MDDIVGLCLKSIAIKHRPELGDVAEAGPLLAEPRDAERRLHR
jgi:hypothetical protein